MKKVIIVVTGTPEPFNGVIREMAWVWTISPKKLLKPLVDKLSYYVEDGFQDKLLSLSRTFNFEINYIRENLQRFNADDSSYKEYRGRVFDTFILWVEGVTKKTTEWLADEGAYSVYVGKREDHTQFLGDGKHLYDFVLNYDDENFEDSVHRIVNILAGKQQEAY